MNFKIYKITNTITNKAYIGQTSETLEKRFNKHVQSAKSKNIKKSYLHKSIDKYGSEHFKIELIEDGIQTKEESNLREIYYIKYLDTQNTGYNQTIGGEGGSGYKHTEETKETLSQQSKKNWARPEFIEKQKKNKRNLGKKNTQETIEKRKKSRVSYEHDKESRDKISNSLKGKKVHNTAFWHITFPDGTEDIILSLTEFCKARGLDPRLMHKVSKGITTHHKQHKCKKIVPEIPFVKLSQNISRNSLPEIRPFFYSHELQFKKEIIESIVRSRHNIYKEKIYARQTKVLQILPEQARSFYDTNHLQGFSASKIHLALIHKSEIVSCMSFTQSRFDKSIEWELTRFCNKLNSTVIGGASKLLSYFIKKYSPKSIISYADTRTFTGGLYEKLGFKKDRIVPPTYFYVHKKEPLTVHRKENFRHNKMKDKLMYYDSNMSEWENMKLNGYYRIYDVEKIAFVLLTKTE